MKIESVDDFMELAGDNGVGFKVEIDDNGFRFAVGWPHHMDQELQKKMQKWVDANDAALAAFLLEMARTGNETLEQGVTIIQPDIDTPETKH